jgi:hypothetical protein
MTDRNPYPLLRPYWKGYSREQDKKLVRKLFYGTTIRDERTGRARHQYLPDDSPEEREGRQALCRLLLFYNLSYNHADPEILGALCCALEGRLWRRLVFRNQRERGRQSDWAADFQITLEVMGLECFSGEKTTAAVAKIAEKFDLSRSAVYEAMARDRKRLKS